MVDTEGNAEKKRRRHAAGPFYRTALTIASPFFRRYRMEGARPENATVYLCRHLNMHGPFSTLTSHGLEARPLILSVFFTHKDCAKQYSDFTFSARAGMPKPIAWLLAHGAALGVVPVVRSLRSIPVYRGQNLRAAETIKKSVEALLDGENIILYPDKDYTAGDEENHEIYEGFLLFERQYYRKTGKHIPFVVLTLDDEHKMIKESAPILFRDGESYIDGSLRVLKEVKEALFPPIEKSEM